MKAKCFECAAVIEADDVAEAFVVHGREKHTWPYPDDALRIYARNYADAVDRLDGPTERLPEIGEAFGGKAHSTGLYACEKLEKEMTSDPGLESAVRELRQQLAGPPPGG